MSSRCYYSRTPLIRKVWGLSLKLRIIGMKFQSYFVYESSFMNRAGFEQVILVFRTFRINSLKKLFHMLKRTLFRTRFRIIPCSNKLSNCIWTCFPFVKYLIGENFIGKKWRTFGLVTKIIPDKLFSRRIFLFLNFMMTEKEINTFFYSNVC